MIGRGICPADLLRLARTPKNRKTLADSNHDQITEYLLGHVGPPQQNLAQQLASVEEDENPKCR
jgi:hypothetical protein